MSADKAEQRFMEALERSGARDPRPYYREQLRLLREADGDLYARGAAYYQGTLLPRVAAADSDPLGEWLEYGRMLVALRIQGETVQIDESGMATPYQRPVPADRLVLHMPTSLREAAVPVGIPPDLSPAQRSAFDLLVRQRVAY